MARHGPPRSHENGAAPYSPPHGAQAHHPTVADSGERHKTLPRIHQGACQGEEAAGGHAAGAGEHAGERTAWLACNELVGA